MVDNTENRTSGHGDGDRAETLATRGRDVAAMFRRRRWSDRGLRGRESHRREIKSTRWLDGYR